MKGWYLGARPDLLPFRKDDDPIFANGTAEICDVSSTWLSRSLRE